MAGIGFELRKLASRDDLLGIVASLTHASIITAGPWLMSILALSGIDLLGSILVDVEKLRLFRMVTIYNFAFTLVSAGPLIIVATRWLADRIYDKKVEQAPGMLLTGMALLIVVQAPIVIYFYGVAADLKPAERVAAIVNYFLIASIWYVGLFLTALRDYGAITMGFAMGMAAAFAFTLLFGHAFGVAGMLTGFSVGIAVILYFQAARIFAEFPYRLTRPFAFLKGFFVYWELALSAFLYNLAIWIDKWLMWTVPGHEIVAGVMISYPLYDSAMFLAYVTVIPAIAIFVLAIETDFYEHYQAFYRNISGHGPLRQLESGHSAILVSLGRGLRNVVVFQGCLTAFLVLIAPTLLTSLGVSLVSLGMFRLGVLGSLFHVLLMFVSIILAYFDLRRSLIWVNLVLLITNGSFTWFTLDMGFAYYGYGYFLSAVVTLGFAYVLAVRALSRLPYLTFVVNNPAVRGS